ncbi:DUF6795 domain-containing protein [Frateuria sp. GZRe12]|uniref:DUF6795 domain-containing protein n=1 Tax=Frateuria sp. GZRe12 TaxID=3351533 RepID=UPI003EDC0BF0
MRGVAGRGRRRSLRSRAAFLVALAVFWSFGLPGVRATGLFDRLVLFSEVHGTVLRGRPTVAGAEFVQKVIWSDEPDEIPPQPPTTNDATGAFRFPAIERGAGLRRMIPAQPMMPQTITIHSKASDTSPGAAEAIPTTTGRNSAGGR